MGLITETVKVKVTSNQIKHYEELGYTIPIREASPSYKQRNKKDYCYDLNKEIEVNVEDLPRGSGHLIECQCDYCGNLFTTTYYIYNKGKEQAVDKTCCENCWREKARECNLINYGFTSPTMTLEVKERMRNTSLQKYGVPNPMQNNQIKKHLIESNLKKYGVPYTAQLKEVKDKIAKTNTERYGYSVPSKNKEVRQKAVDTMYANQTMKTSSQQRYISNLYNMELNYPILYWSVDMYDKENDVCWEFDGGGHFLSVITGKETQEEFNNKELVREKLIRQDGHKIVRIISTTDKLPSDEILLQMLSDAKQYFSDYPNHSWIEFNIDDEIIRNAEHKDGIPYFYGELRRIKESDLKSA